MGMREYPDATYRVDYLTLQNTKGYNELMQKFKTLGISLDDYAHWIQYGDDDYMRDAIMSAMSDQQNELAENDEFYTDTFVDTSIEEIDKLYMTMQKNFKKNHKGFGISLRWISSECVGDVGESFFELTGYIKPKANDIASWVGWSEWC